MSNIIINNKEYNNVPSITFNKVGGGTATYTEGGGGGGTTIEQLNVSEAGTYTAPSGTAYSPVVVPSGSVALDDIYLDETDLYMSANVNASGLVTYNAQYQGYTDAAISSGFVSNYTSGALEITAVGSYQLPTQSVRTITPSTSSQTAVTSGKYTTGEITVDPIPSQYIIPAGTVSITSNGTVDVSQYASASVAVPATATSYLGTNPVKIADYPATTVYLSNTAFTTWTPSTTALVLDSGANVGTAVLDLENYNYCIVWTTKSVFAYNSSATNKAKIVSQSHSINQSIYKSPNNLTNLRAKNYNTNRCTNLIVVGLANYYNSSSSHTLTYTNTLGIYPTSTAATFSSSTSNTPTMTIKSPSFRIVCNASYLSTANAGNIDASNTYFQYWGELWRVDKDSTMFGMYKNIVNAYND